MVGEGAIIRMVGKLVRRGRTPEVVVKAGAVRRNKVTMRGYAGSKLIMRVRQDEGFKIEDDEELLGMLSKGSGRCRRF